jgi:hypothetical protein
MQLMMICDISKRISALIEIDAALGAMASLGFVRLMESVGEEVTT